MRTTSKRLACVVIAILAAGCDPGPAPHANPTRQSDGWGGDDPGQSKPTDATTEPGSTDGFAKPDPGVPAPAVPDPAVPDQGGSGAAGTWQNPIPIQTLPFSHGADTRQAPSQTANSYQPCAPQTNEGGGEVVYRLTLATETAVRIAVDDVAGDGVDVDVHLLSAPSPTSCAQRDNVAVQATLSAGDHWIAVDSWVDAQGMVKAGPYTLTVTEVSGGSSPTGCTTNPLPQCTAGAFPQVNGVPTEAPGDPGCPAGMARVDSFCIDRYEAMLVEVQGGGALAPWSPYRPPASASVRALSVAGAVPQGYISQQQAAQACANAGKRLCSDSEWLRACRGASQQTFPYGNSRQPGVCNDARGCHPVVQYFEGQVSWTGAEMSHPCINQLPDGLARSGDHAGCRTVEGVLDMMGNLHEWTADPNGTFRGGFYADTQVNGDGCLYRTTAHNSSYSDYSTGFRCCK